MSSFLFPSRPGHSNPSERGPGEQAEAKFKAAAQRGPWEGQGSGRAWGGPAYRLLSPCSGIPGWRAPRAALTGSSPGVR